ncbi:MAG: diacylglycerol kinase [Armatimonadetes bacterium]|nr:diacylglycerol kinase [Armatimonadota bacterium]
MKSKNSLAALGHAIDGILHAYRTQRHVRFHFWMVILILIAARVMNFDRSKMVLLFFAISIVLICEMFNTALEAAVDLFTDKYHPLAKHAKDIAAGAVLVAALNAIVIGGFLFIDEQRMKQTFETMLTPLADQAREHPLVPDLLLTMTMTVTIILMIVMMWKVRGRKGTFLQGGVVSGHAALAFFLASVVWFITASLSATVISLFLALLVSQSRIEGRIHTFQETVFGALLGILATLLMYQILPRILVSFIH